MWMEGPTFLKDDESTWPAVLPLKGNAEETSDCKRQTKTRTHVVRSLSAKYRPDRYRHDKSVKFGTELP